MKILRTLILSALLSTTGLGALNVANLAQAATRADLNKDSNQALATLYRTNPAARTIGDHAKAILIFPNIVKAGLVFGGAFGEGELINNDRVDGYYNSFTGSWGLQAGAQSYGYVVFLMNESALNYIHDSAGWEIGVGPTVVVIDEGKAKNISTTTMKDDAYAFIFSQQGLMAGVSIEGTKITRIKE